MVSTDGLETWFDCQLFAVGLTVVCVLGVVVIGWVGGSLPSRALSSTQGALAVATTGFGIIGALILLTGRYRS